MSVKHTYIVAVGEETKVITKAKAIRLHCLDCCGFLPGEVAKCTCHTCALYPFRFGNEKGLERIYIDKGQEDEDEEELDDDEWEAIMSEE